MYLFDLELKKVSIKHSKELFEVFNYLIIDGLMYGTDIFDTMTKWSETNLPWILSLYQRDMTYRSVRDVLFT